MLERKLFVWIVLCATALSAIAAMERADFVAGVGTNGWTISSGEYVSPTYANSVKSVRLDYSGSGNDGITVYAMPAQGDETQVATLSAASSSATFEFPDFMNFRSFHIAVGGGMNLASFAASVYASNDAFPLSALSGNTYTQNFDSLSSITATAGEKEWQNGITLQYWQAWSGANAVEKFNYNAGKATTSGLYALAPKQSDSVRAFGARVKQNLTITWGMAFANDTDWELYLSNVTYSAQQWGFANTNSHALTCSYLVTNRLDWISNISDGWIDCCETLAQCLSATSQHETPVVTAVDFTPPNRVRIPAGCVLLFKWTLTPPVSGSSAMMAIDDLKVTFAEKPYPLLIRLADSGSALGDGS